jgi:ABC-type transport system involved in multi-copper enzyme maturation permease subunit
MTSYLPFEWLKLTRRWMPRIILLMLMALTVLAFWGQASRSFGPDNVLLPRAWLAVLTFCSFFAPFFWPVLGGSWAGNEYGWGTIRSILTRRPFRITHILSAFVVLCAGLGVALLALLVTGTIAGLVVALLTGNSAFTSGVWDATFAGVLVKGFLTAWYVSAFYLLIAYAAGVVFRSAAVGIGIGIGSTLAEIILTGIFRALGGTWNDIAQHFPFRYSQDMISQVVHSGLVAGSGLGSVEPGTPSASESFIAVAIYAAALLAAMCVAVRTRDVTA